MGALRSLRWYDWLWCALPLGLLATRDWFGVLCGLAAFAFNLRAFAGGQEGRLKYMVTLLAAITAVIIYLVAGLIFVGLLTPSL